MSKERKSKEYCDDEDRCENKGLYCCDNCTRNYNYEEADDWFSEKEEAVSE